MSTNSEEYKKNLKKKTDSYKEKEQSKWDNMDSN